MEKVVNVLSLFDGKRCGAYCLQQAGIKINKYYASEINKYAIQVADDYFPAAINLGDITNWREWDIDWASIELIMAGFPCQAWSFSGEQKGLDDPRGALVLVLIEIWEHIKSLNPNVKFFFENVFMKAKYENFINELFGVNPHKIESNQIAPVDRKRNYWTNIKFDKITPVKISFGDIREWGVQDNFYYSEAAFNWLSNHAKRKGKDLKVFTNSGKMQMLEATMYKKYSSQRFFGVLDHKGIRYPTVLECERCHGLPDGYTKSVSNTQAYEMIGNGWECRTVTHIFKGLINGNN